MQLFIFKSKSIAFLNLFVFTSLFLNQVYCCSLWRPNKLPDDTYMLLLSLVFIIIVTFCCIFIACIPHLMPTTWITFVNICKDSYKRGHRCWAGKLVSPWNNSLLQLSDNNMSVAHFWYKLQLFINAVCIFYFMFVSFNSCSIDCKLLDKR
jgi:hypothetical protein